MALARCIAGPIGRFASEATGTVAVWFGLSCMTLLVLAGGGLDLARSINQKTQMQGAVDAAALAGASAYTSATSVTTAQAVAKNYMDNFKTTSGITSLAYTITPGSSTSGGSVALYSMKVTATSTISNTLMKMTNATNEVDVTATANNPVYNIKISMSGFSSSAVDTDTISYYTVPADNSTPPTTTLLYSNAANAATSSGTTTVQLTASQKLGFMLTNTTDGNKVTTTTTCTLLQTLLQGCKSGTTSNSYGSNSYGGTVNSVHYFYSHMSPPSLLAYPSVTQNCNLQVLTSSTATPTSGSCLSALPAYATVNCVQASGMTLTYYWNDMGGATDDKDYNDAVYTVTCSQVSSGTSKGLVLTN